MAKTFTKTFRLLFGAGRKFVAQPGEAWLICRWRGGWCRFGSNASVSVAPRAESLPARNDSAGRQAGLQERFAKSIDLLLSADVFVFKPICWKRAAVLHRYRQERD